MHHNKLMYFDITLLDCMEIIDITYEKIIDVDRIEIHIEGMNFFFIVQYDDEGVDEWLVIKKTKECLRGKQMYAYLENNMVESKQRNILLIALENLKFSYETDKIYLSFWCEEAEKYILKHNEDKELRYAYADIAFINEDENVPFSIKNALEYIGENIIEYLNYLESQIIEIVGQEDMEQIVGRIYQLYKQRKN